MKIPVPSNPYLLLCLSTAFFSGCEEKIKPPDRNELLTSVVWGETNDEVTDPEFYTCVFESGGKYYTTWRGFETFNSTWRLLSNNKLRIDQSEVEIATLTENVFEYKGEVSFFGFFTYKKTFHLEALKNTNASTLGITELAKTSVKLHGMIRSCDQSTVSLEYGTTDSYGSVLPQGAIIFSGAVNRHIEVVLTGLSPGTVYHYRLKVVNKSGTFYGQDQTFRTFNDMTISDADNNTYNTVTIGNQVWMAENLKTTKYNDGTLIYGIRDNNEWSGFSEPAYCWYWNDSVTYGSTGAIYNWQTVSTGKLCPAGWHVPTLNEWINLTLSHAGKGTGLMEGHFNIDLNRLWLEGTNETGFSARESLVRLPDGSFGGSDCHLWTATEYSPDEAQHIMIYYNTAGYYHRSKKHGMPVRCLKD